MADRNYAFYTLPLLALAALPVSGAGTDEPAIPTAARTASGFVPKGWFIYDQATGDLNRDGIPDLALVLANEREKTVSGPIVVDESLPARRLVIALGTRDGYRRAVVDEGAVDTVDGEHDLTIHKGVLTTKMTTSGTGSRTDVDKYEWRERVFEQIGHTTSEFGRGYGYTADTNLITGLVEERHSSREHMHQDVAEPRFVGKRSFRMIAIAPRPSSPRDLSVPLTSMPVPLRTRRDVSVGALRWRGPSDFSATITGAMVGRGERARLCLRVNVTDRRRGAADQVRMLSARGKPVPTLSEHRQRTSMGFAWEGWYNPALLGLDYHRQRDSGKPVGTAQWFFQDKEVSDVNFFRGTVELTRPEPEITLSTSQGGRTIPGLFWLTCQTHLPRLGDDNCDHYFY